MLSIQTLSNSKGASKYYTESYQYYSSDITELKEAITWHGKLAAEFELRGFVSSESFKSLLEGKMPNGQQLGRKTSEGVKHRPGYDLTFTAPKSVSILLAFTEDKAFKAKLLNAFDKAVFETLDHIENEYAEARRFKDHDIEYEKTGNLAIATFRQESSRNGDPNFHRHCVVLNATKCYDGKIRALSSDIASNHGFQETLYKDKILNGLIFRSKLAQTVKELGFNIDVMREDGLWEIKGIPEDILKHYSSRRTEIEETLEKWGADTAEAASEANLITRKAKNSCTPEFNKDYLLQHEFSVDDFISEPSKFEERDYSRSSFIESLQNKLAKYFGQDKEEHIGHSYKAVRYAVMHLSEKHAAFTRKDIIKSALTHGLGYTNLQEIQIALDQFVKEGRVIPVGEMFTTERNLKIENTTLSYIVAGINQVSKIAYKRDISKFSGSSELHLTNSQYQALIDMCSSKDRVHGIQGDPGVGKTTLVNRFIDIASSKGYEIKLLAPTDSAMKALKEATGIEAISPRAMIRQLKKINGDDLSRTIIVSDETSMLSFKDKLDLVRLVSKRNARLFLMGDKHQLPGFEGGDAFRLVQNTVMKTSKVDEIVRQESPELRKFVSMLAKGNIQEAFCEPVTVVEEPLKEDRITSIVDHYIQKSETERDDILIMAGTHKERQEIHLQLRESLKKEGVLSECPLMIERLKPLNMSLTEQKYAKHYKPGMVVRFNQSYQKLHIESGDYLEIAKPTKEDIKQNCLRLKRSDGKVFKWDIIKFGAGKKHAIEIYESEPIELQKGERLLWRRSSKEKGIINSELARIKRINHKEKSITLQLENKKEVTLKTSDRKLQHIDYGYTLTDYAAQGKTAKYAISSMTSQSAFSADFRHALVQFSRMKKDLMILTDNKEKLINTLSKRDGIVLNALEYTTPNQYQNYFKNEERVAKIERYLENLQEHKALQNLSQKINYCEDRRPNLESKYDDKARRNLAHLQAQEQLKFQQFQSQNRAQKSQETAKEI